MGRKAFALLVTGLFLYVCLPLIFPVAMGGVLAVLFDPFVEKLERRKISRSMGSGLVTIAVSLVILLPTSLLIFFGVKTGFRQMQAWRDSPQVTSSGGMMDSIIASERFHAISEWIKAWFPSLEPEQLVTAAQDIGRAGGLKLADLFGQFVGYLPGMGLALVVVAVSLYFLLVDGHRVLLFSRRNSPFSPVQTEQLVGAVAGVCRSVILASVVSGAAQAFFETFICLVTRVPNIPLIGLLVFMGSFVPMVGSVPVTAGVAIHQFLLGRTQAGFVLVVAAIVVSMLDNFIRPIFLRGSANLHPLLAFVTAFGGLQMLGFLGVFLGPVIAALFVATIHILATPDATERA